MSSPTAKLPAPGASARLSALAARAWFEAARIGMDAAFDTTLNTWHYAVSLARTAEIAAERALDAQRRLVRDLLRD